MQDGAEAIILNEFVAGNEEEDEGDAHDELSIIKPWQQEEEDNQDEGVAEQQQQQQSEMVAPAAVVQQQNPSQPADEAATNPSNNQ